MLHAQPLVWVHFCGMLPRIPRSCRTHGNTISCSIYVDAIARALAALVLSHHAAWRYCRHGLRPYCGDVCREMETPEEKAARRQAKRDKKARKSMRADSMADSAGGRTVDISDITS